MSQEALSRELALRIGLAARALPDTDTKRLLYVLTEGNKKAVTETTLSKLKIKQLKSACDGELSSMEQADLQQAVAILKGENNASKPELPETVAFKEGDMPHSIRIACASNTGFKIDGHFGSCVMFLIYQVSTSESRLIEIRLTKLPVDAENIDKNDFRANLIKDCQVLYIASVGGPAAAKIVKKGIHPIKMPGQDTVSNIINQLQQVIADSPPPWLAKAMGISTEQRVRFEQVEAG